VTRPLGAAPSLGRASALGALGTLGSRGSGFVRTVIVAAAVGVGTGFADDYTIANTTPNVVYDLLLGGILTSVVVPVLVRAHREDDDGGTAFSQALLSTVAAGLAVVTVLAVLAAPLIVDAYQSGSVPPTDHDRAVLFARFFLPQLLFYGVTATAGAVLNTRGRFGRDTAVPVLNNLVVIATAVVFLALPGPRPPQAATATTAQVLVLAIGTTLGVVVMALALVPSLRAAGVPWRWRFDLPRERLALTGRLAGWVLVAVAASQTAFVVVTRLASSRQGVAAYANAYQLFQLPYAVVGVSVVSALLPSMSRHAAAGRPDLLRADVSRGLRLAAVLVVPGSLALAALAVPLAVAALHGAAGGQRAVLVGQVLAVLALGLVPFTVHQMLLRSFYAAADSRTPALLSVLVAVLTVGFDLGVAAAVPGPRRVVGLAAGFSAAYAVGAGVAAVLVRRRLGGRGSRTTRLLLRVTLASAVAVGVGWLPATAAGHLVRGTPGALLGLGLAGAIIPPLYLAGLRATRVREVEPLLARLRRSGGATSTQAARTPTHTG